MKCFPLFASLLLATCAQAPKKPLDGTGNAQFEPFVPVGGRATITDTSQFLAGRPVSSGAALSRLQQTRQYSEFSRQNLWQWEKMALPRVGRQRSWQAMYLQPLIGTPHAVVYPFGGPDLLYALSLFPNAPRYILLGMEPVGNVPDLEASDPGAVLGALDGLERTVATQLQHGYFITKDMKTDLNNGPLQGVIPVLLTALGLMDAHIDGVNFINAGGNPGVEINFLLPGRRWQTAIYVAGDLSNAGFQGGYRQWLSSQAAGSVAYFKAASYLMHDNRFSAARNWVLGTSRAVVQDDSGIPYSFFDQSIWQVNLFGSYRAPIDLFSKHAQPSLREAYQFSGPRPPLTFGSGYAMEASAANLTVAVRR